MVFDYVCLKHRFRCLLLKCWEVFYRYTAPKFPILNIHYLLNTDTGINLTYFRVENDLQREIFNNFITLYMQ